MGVSSGFPRFQGWHRPPLEARRRSHRRPSGPGAWWGRTLWSIALLVVGSALVYAVTGLDRGGGAGVANMPDAPRATEARLVDDATLEVDVVGPENVEYCLRANIVDAAAPICAVRSQGTVAFTGEAVTEAGPELAGTAVAVTLRARLSGSEGPGDADQEVRWVETEPSDPVEVVVAP